MIIPFLAVAAALGVVVALSTRWRRYPIRAAPSLPRHAWLLPLAIAPQVLWTHWLSHLGAIAEGYGWILPLSYLPVLLFLAANRAFAWTWVIGVGVGLNLTVMVLNGGTMPAPARFAASPPAGATAAVIAPGTKDRVFDDTSPALLAPLQDQYVVTFPWGTQRLVSIGDFVSLGGALLGLVSAL